MQTSKRELRRLNADPVDIEYVGIGLAIRCIEHNAGCGLDEVALQNLRHEGERTRRTQVTLDNLHVVVLSQILNIERTADVQLLSDLAADLLDSASGLEVDLLGREDERCVTRVNARKLDVLRDGILDNLTVLSHSVELDLLSVLQELRNHYGVLLRYLGSGCEESFELLLVVANVHCCTRKHIRRTHQNGVANLIDKVVDVLHIRQLLPRGLVDAELIEHTRELVAVLGAVDRQRRRTQHGDILVVELHCQVVGDLTTHRNDHASRCFEIQHVHHALERQLVEVQTVAHIVVGRNGLGVVVDHHRLIAQLAGGLDSIHRAPVELNRRADAVCTRTQNHNRFLILEERNIVILTVVGHIKIVGQLGVLRCHRIDSLNGRHDVSLLTQRANCQCLLVHILAVLADETCDLEVREAQSLSLPKHLGGQLLDRIVATQYQRVVVDILQFFEEPGRNLGQLEQTLDRVALLQSLGNGKHTQVGRVRQLLVQIVKVLVLVAHETVHTLADHTQTLLDHLLERLTDRHNLTHRLHRRADLARYACELREVPTRDLADQVVQLGSLICRIGSIHLANLVERVTQCQLCCNKCQRITRSLRRQCRRTAQTSINLDHAVVVGIRVERILNVTLADNTDMADNLNRQLLQHLQLTLVERAGGSHYDRLTGVDTQRVEVLHTCNGKAVVVAVADNLKLDLLPAFERLLDQNLLRVSERTLAQLHKLLLVAADTTTQATQRISRANHNREADLASCCDSVLHRLYGLRDGGLDVDLVELLHEQIAVLGCHNSLDRRAEHLDAILLQNTFLVQFRTAVQRGLTTECEQNTVGLLFFDDLLNEVRGYGQEVDAVGDAFRGLDCCDVGVDQHGLNTLFAHSFQRLRT